MLERIYQLCDRSGIRIARLEKELGFANASIKKAKESTIGAERLKAIADYFHVSMEYLLTGSASKYYDISQFEYEVILALRKADAIDHGSVIRTLHLEEKEKEAAINE